MWAGAAAAAYLFAHQQHIPPATVWLILPAFLLEIAFYLAPGFDAPRRSLESVRPPVLRAAVLAVTAVLPYLLATLRTGSFQFAEFGLLAVFCVVLAFWYVVTKAGALADFLFLAVTAAVFLSKVFTQIYPDPAPHAQLAWLGRLMWIRLSISAILSVRGWNEQYGFLPTAREWRIGWEQFFLFLPVGGLVAYLLHAVQFKLASPVWWKVPLVAIGTFLGFLWVLALAEEFFFRGFLQQLLSRAMNNKMAGLIVASALFGLAHLPFRHFPNWKWVILTFVLGLTCGMAYWRAGNVRASVVTHALVVAAWRSFFNG